MTSTTGMALVLTVVAGWLVSCATAPSSRADKEALLAEAASTLRRLRAEHPGVDLIVQHYSYALFPTVIKGGLVVGGARSQGVVYAQGRHVGYCDLTQGSVGALELSAMEVCGLELGTLEVGEGCVGVAEVHIC